MAWTGQKVDLMKDPNVRRRRAKWLADRFGRMGLDVPADLSRRAHSMTRLERRAAVALARDMAEAESESALHPAARPPGLSDAEWRAQRNALRRVRQGRAG